MDREAANSPRLIFELVKRISSGLKPGFFVLELGCGNGNVLRVLQKACPEAVVVGLELWFDGLRHARRRGTLVHQMILTLEARGLIERTPWQARSIHLLIRREELPDLL